MPFFCPATRTWSPTSTFSPSVSRLATDDFFLWAENAQQIHSMTLTAWTDMYHKHDLWIQSSFPMSPLWRKLIFVTKKKTTLELCHLFLSPSSLSPSWSFQPGGRPGLCGGFGGWRWQTKVSDRHPWKSLTLGQKSLQGRKKRQTHRNVKASGQRQTC